jgi:hypothetical protein
MAGHCCNLSDAFCNLARRRVHEGIVEKGFGLWLGRFAALESVQRQSGGVKVRIPECTGNKGKNIVEQVKR